VTCDERWLAANWPFVRAWLPAAPARVLEIGCGPLGGFVPMMEAAGYQAAGVDPEAPPGPAYRQAGFERHAVPGQLDAIVACTSQAQWRESGQSWDACLRSWVHAEGLHAGQEILDELDARFDCQALAYGPYFFADLAATGDADEQAAIDSGLIQANRIQYAGRRKSRPPASSA
jgi:hypothetical protein